MNGIFVPASYQEELAFEIEGHRAYRRSLVAALPTLQGDHFEEVRGSIKWSVAEQGRLERELEIVRKQKTSPSPSEGGELPKTNTSGIVEAITL